MKKIKLLTSTFAALIMGSALPLVAKAPHDLIVVLSSDINDAIAGEFWTASQMIERRAPMETQLCFLSGGSNPKVLAKFKKQKYPNKRIAREKAAKNFGGIVRFIDQSRKANQGKQVLASLDVPSVIDAVENQVDGEARIILMGSSLWLRKADEAFVDLSQSEVDLRFRVPSLAKLDQDPLLSSYHSTKNRKKFEAVDVLWWNPVSDEATSGPDEYQRLCGEFWATYLDRAGITLFSVQKDMQPFLAYVFETKIDKIAPAYSRGRAAPQMLTLADLVEEKNQEAAEQARLRAELLAKQEAEEQAKRDAEAHRLRMQDLRRQQEVVDAQRKLVQLEKQAAYEAKMSRPVALPNLSEIFIADCSGSMKSYLDRVGREMSMRKLAKSERIALILYSDHDRADQSKEIAYLFSESSKASDLASAFRGVDLLGGTTVPEALDRGLLVALETLRERPNSKGVKISIFTDAVPHQPGDIKGYPSNQPSPQALIGQLLSAGHSVTLYRCGGVDTGWVPKGVVIKDL